MSVFQRGETWYYKFIIKGRIYYKAVPEATSREDAEKAEIRVKSDLLQGKYDLAEDVGEMLLNELINKFVEYAKVNRISWERSDSHMVNTIKDFFKSKKLREITPFLVEKYRLARKSKERANSTINKEVRLLRRIFNMAIDNGWANTNPCSSKKIKPLREENKKERFLLPDEEERLLAACVGQVAYLRPIIITALQTGIRKQGILTLEWEDIDLKNGYITLLKTKNGKKFNVPISSLLMKELKKLYANKSSKFVFMNPNTNERVKDIRSAYKAVCNRAHVEKLTFHMLRHTAATRMVATGIDLVVVQRILGHSDIKSTMVYAHPLPEREKLAVEALANYGNQKKKVIQMVSTNK